MAYCNKKGSFCKETVRQMKHGLLFVLYYYLYHIRGSADSYTQHITDGLVLIKVFVIQSVYIVNRK